MKKPRLLITNILVFLITGLIALVATPIEGIIYGFDGVEIFTCIFLIYFSGMSITAGYHRLWSHKAYDANVVVSSYPGNRRCYGTAKQYFTLGI